MVYMLPTHRDLYFILHDNFSKFCGDLFATMYPNNEVLSPRSRNNDIVKKYKEKQSQMNILLCICNFTYYENQQNVTNLYICLRNIPFVAQFSADECLKIISSYVVGDIRKPMMQFDAGTVMYDSHIKSGTLVLDSRSHPINGHEIL